jgi:c-di-GMP-binding flagellar brake protein YcgR
VVANFNLHNGQVVKLKEKNKDGSRKYKAKVVGINSDSLDLKLLELASNSDLLKVNQVYTIYFEGSNHLYQLDIKLQKINESNQVLVVDSVGELRTNERRRYMRVDVEEKIKYQLNNDPNYYDALMVDISASGMKLETANITNLNLETEIRIDCSSVDNFPVDELAARVLRIRVNQNRSQHNKKYYLGVEFTSVEDEIREKLIDWVYQKKDESRKES